MKDILTYTVSSNNILGTWKSEVDLLLANFKTSYAANHASSYSNIFKDAIKTKYAL